MTAEQIISHRMKSASCSRRNEEAPITPQICLCLEYDDNTQNFIVELKCCKNLMSPQEVLFPQKTDPSQPQQASGIQRGKPFNVLVKLELIPDFDGMPKWSSSVKKGTRDPDWTDENGGENGKGKRFEWNVAKEILALQNLWITVWDVDHLPLPDPFRAKKLLGELTIPLRSENFQNKGARLEALVLPRNVKMLRSTFTIGSTRSEVSYLGQIEVSLQLEYALPSWHKI